MNEEEKRYKIEKIEKINKDVKRKKYVAIIHAINSASYAICLSSHCKDLYFLVSVLCVTVSLSFNVLNKNSITYLLYTICIIKENMKSIICYL